MSQKRTFSQTLRSELSWYFISLLFCVVILFPIYYFKVEYDFWVGNVIAVFGLSVLLRWIFLWSYTPFAWWLYFKVVLAFLMIPLFFYTIDSFAGFKDFINEVGFPEILQHVEGPDQFALAKYIQNQMTFFSVSFMMCILIIPFKMIWSIWKQLNRNEV
ncbi:MAG: hypothetical protein IPM48_03660 [Saprospiraceae bacterium]|nr:hypothetical protein [Saprospiraceae bacterium]